MLATHKRRKFQVLIVEYPRPNHNLKSPHGDQFYVVEPLDNKGTYVYISKPYFEAQYGIHRTAASS